jgi:hypothetical protein
MILGHECMWMLSSGIILVVVDQTLRICMYKMALQSNVDRRPAPTHTKLQVKNLVKSSCGRPHTSSSECIVSILLVLSISSQSGMAPNVRPRSTLHRAPASDLLHATTRYHSSPSPSHLAALAAHAAAIRISSLPDIDLWSRSRVCPRGIY